MTKYPVIIHIPYNSSYIPDCEREMLLLSDSELKNQIMELTDWYINEIFDNDDIEVYRSFVSRLVFDPLKMRDDKKEQAAEYGMGAIYSNTSNGEVLRILDYNQKEEMLKAYYDPYHKKFSELINLYLERHGRCLIVNIQTFNTDPMPYEPDKQQRPSFCIGTDDYHTAHKIPQFIYDYFYWRENESVAFNMPLKGAFVPMGHYTLDKRVHSIKLGIKRSLYMDEASGLKSKDFTDLKNMLQNFINELLQFFLTLE